MLSESKTSLIITPKTVQLAPNLSWVTDGKSANSLIDCYEQQTRFIPLPEKLQIKKAESIREGKAYRITGKIDKFDQDFILLHGAEGRIYTVGNGLPCSEKGLVNFHKTPTIAKYQEKNSSHTY